MRIYVLFCVLALSLCSLTAHADVSLGVASPAATFSPGNWSGNDGRGGNVSRTTWVNGAWCEWQWKSPSAAPTASLHISNATPGSFISYFADGALTTDVPVSAQGTIPITGLGTAGVHTLIVYTAKSAQQARWNLTNAYTVTGLDVDDGSTPITRPMHPWVMIVGDSITEGINAGSSLGDYAFLVGQGLKTRGYDTGVTACGWSGWLRPGDSTRDVPGYYEVTNGVYSEADSRWDKIDAHTSLLDSQGHISGQGLPSQEPAAILLNYVVNEALGHSNIADTQKSVTGCLAALRKAAPDAKIIVLVPPGLYDAKIYPDGASYIAALEDGLSQYQKANPSDQKTTLLDLGPTVAQTLGSKPYGGGVHYNPAGHAYLTAVLLPRLLAVIDAPQKR